MKYYTLVGFNFKTKKVFASRLAAIRYAFKHLRYNSQLIEEIDRGNHEIEYRCNDRQGFIIRREVKEI